MTPLLFVDHATALGGAERSVLLLAEHLTRHRWQPHLATVGGALAQEAAAQGVVVHQMALPRLRRSARASVDWFSAARELALLARQQDAAVLVSNTVRSTLYVALAARLARRPWVWYMRDFWLSEAEPRYPLADWGLKVLLAAGAARIIANSRAVAARLPHAGKVRVVHNGIDVAHFDAQAVAPLSLPPDKLVVGMVGRLRPWKGQLRFLEMAARVRERRRDTHFLLVGGDPFGVRDGYEAELEGAVAQLGLRDHVTFTGQLSDVRPALAAMDIFVHPGEPEPFGLVNVEAMAMGLPVVAIAHGALPEIVNHGSSGLLVRSPQASLLADAVTTLLAQPAARQQMGRTARERVANYFDIQRTAAQVSQILREVVDE